MSAFIYGDGSDGNITISSNTTLVRDMQYNNLTINSGNILNTAGYRVRVLDTFLNNGTIVDNSDTGGSGGAQAVSSPGIGTGGPSSTGGTLQGGIGTDGNLGSSGIGTGGAGGASGGSGGISPWCEIHDTIHYEAGGIGGAGGDGGDGGGSILIYSTNFNNQGIIDGDGANGANGANGGEGQAGYGDREWWHKGGGGGGGQAGAGGNGATIEIIYNTLVNIGTITYDGGSSGTPGNGYPQSIAKEGYWRYNYCYDGGVSVGGGDGGGSTGHDVSLGYYGEPKIKAGAGGDGSYNRDGDDGILYIGTYEDSDWIESVSGSNFVNVSGRLYSKYNSYSIEFDYKSSGNCSAYKVINYGSSINDTQHKLEGNIYIPLLEAGGTVTFKYQWLTSADAVISTTTIETFTSTQEYTKYYTDWLNAPTNAEKLKVILECTGSGDIHAFLDDCLMRTVPDYGIRISDISGNKNTITTKNASIIAAGTYTMPNSLNGDNTYGIDISLGQTVSEDDIGVIVIPGLANINSKAIYCIVSGTLYQTTHYANSADTYYTRNDSTGAMTTWSAGAMSSSNQSTFDPILCAFPIAFWDKRGASTFSSIRLFAATCYLVRDASTYTGDSDYYGTNIKVYSIGSEGVSEITYLVCLKKH